MNEKLELLMEKACQLRIDAAELTGNQTILNEMEDMIDEIEQALEQNQLHRPAT